MVIACLMSGCAEPDPTAKKVQNQNQQNQQNQLVSSTTQSAATNTANESTAATKTTTSASDAPVNVPPVITQTPSVSNSAPSLKIELSGVALPQSLPTGSAMTFGVQYEVSGTIDSASTYEWVIESSHGPWKQRVTLQRRGELHALVPEWPPEAGDYTTYIQQISPSGGSTIVSKRLKLTYSCQ